MSNTILKNVNLLTMQDNEHPYGLLENAAIVISGDKIKWLGSMKQFSHYEEDNSIDCLGAYASPGLIDCHTHLIYGGDRIDEFEKRLNGVSYEEITRLGGGIKSTVRATRSSSEQELFLTALKRLSNLISEGVTTVEVKSGYGLDTSTEIKMLNVARNLNAFCDVDVLSTFLGAHTVPDEFANNREGYVNLIIEEMLPHIAKENLADAVDGFCETIGFTSDEIERIFKAALQFNLPVKLHAEQLSDQNGALLASKYNALSADHLEYLNEGGVIAMKESGTVAVLLPGAYYTLRDTKLPPIELLRKHGVPIAVATDSNPGSSPMLSLKLMINMASTIFRLTPEEALKGVTCNAALALGLKDRGVLKVGNKADIVIWDISHPAELAYFAGGSHTLRVIKSGVFINE